jgi:hypothetical protein
MDWQRLVYRFTEIDMSVVSAILEDLTYGSAGIRSPDPALQPLIPISGDLLSLSPLFFMHLDPERNLTVLLNRIPLEKSIYVQIVGQKEALMRDQLADVARQSGFRTFSGRLSSDPDLPDVDIAIVSDIEHVCLVCELKWFIEPAEAREILQKEEEIAKGIAQIQQLLQAITVSDGHLPSLGINQHYDVYGVVLSKNWIGNATPAQTSTPVINAEHFTRKLASKSSLSALALWLERRAYLPTENVDFRVVATIHEVSGFTLEWYGIQPLAKDPFMPIDWVEA